MYVFLFYLFALLATCFYLARYGGRTGRWLAAIQLGMASASALASWITPRLTELLPHMMVIDLVSLALKTAVACASTRRWPIWVAAFQFNTVLAEAAILLSPAFRGAFYYAMATAWAMPTLVVMVLGLALDRRAERGRRGGEGSIQPAGALGGARTDDAGSAFR